MPKNQVPLDGSLVNDAKAAALLFGRTPAAQLEAWVRLGMVVEATCSGSSIKKIKLAASIHKLGDATPSSPT